MNKTICSLNFMYSMEGFATSIYRRQSGAFKGTAISEKLTYAVENERQHAQDLRNRITELHATPARFAFLFQMMGSLLGLVGRLSGKAPMLKADIMIEKRAVRDYSYFLKQMGFDDETKSLIRNIIADEELHVRNWQDSLKILKGQTY